VLRRQAAEENGDAIAFRRRERTLGRPREMLSRPLRREARLQRRTFGLYAPPNFFFNVLSSAKWDRGDAHDCHPFR
jgi:hypothetical protein